MAVNSGKYLLALGVNTLVCEYTAVISVEFVVWAAVSRKKSYLSHVSS